VKTATGPHKTTCSVGRGLFSPELNNGDAKPKAHLHLAARLRATGVIHPLYTHPYIKSVHTVAYCVLPLLITGEDFMLERSGKTTSIF